MKASTLSNALRKVLSLLLVVVVIVSTMPVYAADMSENGITAGDEGFLEFEEWLAGEIFGGAEEGLTIHQDAGVFAVTLGSSELENLEGVRSLGDFGHGSNGKFIAPISAPDPNAIPIYTAQDLWEVRYNLSGSYVLMNDIDLSTINGGEWEPIGIDIDSVHGEPFEGYFDGQGYVVRNMNVVGPRAFGGLFAYLAGASILNLGLETLSIQGNFFAAGGLCESAGNSAISNCYASGTILAEGEGIGGLCGYIHSSSIVDCYTSGTILADSERIGGLCGYIDSSSIDDCYNLGEVRATTSLESRVGGICGSMSFSSIRNCYNAGNIGLEHESSAGGIVGYVLSGDISDCYNTGTITATGEAGGIFGLSGYNADFGVGSCYNTGAILVNSLYAEANAGGIGGHHSSSRGSVYECYNSGEISILCDSGGDSASAGGIFGITSGSVHYSYNEGDVTINGPQYSVAPFASAGGICGNGGYVEEAYNTGNVSAVSGAYSYVGGISGCGSEAIGCYNTGDISSSATGDITFSAGDSYTGGILGRGAVVERSYNTGKVVSSGSVYSYAGGICGTTEFLSGSALYSISDCYNTGDVHSSVSGLEEHDRSYAGGIFGYFGELGGSVSGCYNTGEVWSSNPGAYSYAGGIGGATFGEAITECYNTGIVQSSYASEGTYAGGICAWSDSSIRDCFNTASVSTSSPNNVHAGGICGWLNVSGSVFQCFNSGDVSSNADTTNPEEEIVSHAGGISGYARGGSIVSASYWNSDGQQKVNGISRTVDEKLGTGLLDEGAVDQSQPLTTTEMKARLHYATNYDGFGFEHTWCFVEGENEGYPVFRSYYPPPEEIIVVEPQFYLTAHDTAVIETIATPVNLFPAGKWFNDGSSAASVTHLGIITAHEPGNARFTFISFDEYCVAECYVSVDPLEATSIEINGPDLTLRISENYEYSATVYPENASYKEAIWSSSDANVVDVGVSDGYVNAQYPGITTITATSHNGLSDTRTVTVFEPVMVDTQEDSYVSLRVGEQNSLSIDIYPEEPLSITQRDIVWSISNDNASIVGYSNEKYTATIEGKSVGEATVTATVTDTTNGVSTTDSLSYNLTMYSVAVGGVELPQEVSLVIGEPQSITATIIPSDAVNKNVFWHSSDEGMVSIEGTGLTVTLTAWEVGEALITVTTEDGNYSSERWVMVFDAPIDVEGIDLPPFLALGKGKTGTLYPSFTPSDTTSRGVVWSTDNADIAIVDSNGTVTALETGVANITATTECGRYSATCAVVITVPTTGVMLHKTKVLVMAGMTEVLAASVLPSNAENKNVIWSSSNQAVATVNENGRITAVASGVAVITVTSAERDDFYAQCTVEVKPLAPTVKIGQANTVYTDDADAIVIPWSIVGSLIDYDTQPSVEVYRNDILYSNYTYSPEGITLAPADLSYPNFKDRYTIKISVENSYGDKGSDNIAFDVYNHSALEEELVPQIVLGNTDKVALHSSDEIFADRVGITLVGDMPAFAKYPWTVQDGLLWQTADEAIAEVFYLSPSGWAKVLPNVALSPDTPIRVLGQAAGSTSLIVTHEITGISKTIQVSVATLENQLFLLRVSPSQLVQLSYTNGVGQIVSRKAETLGETSRGEFAIYEDSGIIGDIKFQAYAGGTLYLGSVAAAKLHSGENGVSSYPVNVISLTKATTQAFYPYKPDGSHYTGSVEVYGGLYVNSILVNESIIEGINPERGASGSFTLNMDSAIFADVSLDVQIQFVYEVIFDDGYVPQIITVDGHLNDNRSVRLSDAVIRLQAWDGQFIASQYLYEEGETFDVTSNNTYITMHGGSDAGVLTANIIARSDVVAENIKIVDQYGYSPKQNADVANEDYAFISGKYNYVSLDMTVNNELKLQPGEIRYYSLSGSSAASAMQKADLPFGIFSKPEQEIPADLLGFNFSLNGLVSDSSFIKSVLGERGGSDVVVSLLGKLAPPSINNVPDVLGFKINITQKEDNPLVYKVKGVLDLKKEKDKTVVYWSTGDKAYSMHLNPNCLGLTNPPPPSIKNGSMEDAFKANRSHQCQFNGYEHGCRQRWQEKSAAFEKEYNKAKDNFNKSKNGKTTVDFEGYFEAEIGYDISQRKWVLAWNEVGITFKAKYDYNYSHSIPIPAPVPGLAVTIEFSAGVGLEIGVKALPSKIFSGQNSAEWIILEAKTNGYLRLRGAIGIDIWVAAANVGVFGQVDLSAEFIMQLLALNPAARYKVDGSVGIDMSWRIGPNATIWIPFKGNVKLYKTGRTVFWDYKMSTGWRRIFGDQSLFDASSKASSGITSFSMYASLLEAFVDERLNDIPSLQLPVAEPVMAYDESNRALAAWISSGLTDEVLMNYDIFDDTREWDELSELEQAESVSAFLDMAGYSGVTVSVYQSDGWQDPETISGDSTVPNLNPKVAISGDNMAVVWQQMVLLENGTEFSVASTELWYSLYDGVQWTEARKIDASINSEISEYAVAMNDTDLAIILTMKTDDGGNDVHLIHLKDYLQANSVVQSRLTNDANIKLNPQIVRSGPNFFFSYYTDDMEGKFDVNTGMLHSTGSIVPRSVQSINAMASQQGYALSSNYKLIANSRGEAAVVWAGYDDAGSGDAVYAIRVVNNNDVLVCAGSMKLVATQVGDLLTVLDGFYSADGELTVLYNQVDYEEYATYLTLLSTTSEEIVKPGTDKLAIGTFENTFSYSIVVNENEATPHYDLPLELLLVNSGVEPVTKISIDWGVGLTPSQWNTHVLPNDIFTDETTYISLGDHIENLNYVVYVHYESGDVLEQSGILTLAKPDISIGSVVLTKSEQGKREFALNLYNQSTVDLANSGYTVHLSFFSDAMRTEPILVEGAVDIVSNDQLALIDVGGLSLTYVYAFTADDASDNGEIPSERIRVFVTSEVRKGATVVEESDYSANEAHLTLHSLIRHNQDAVTASLKSLETGETGSTAHIVVFNRSLKNIPAHSGRLVAHLLDEEKNIVDTQVVVIDQLLGKETVADYGVSFDKSGVDVVALFNEISSSGVDSTLGSLNLSEIPFTFGDPEADDGIVNLTALNTNKVSRTKLIASAKNPNALIYIDGNLCSDASGVATLDIPLSSSAVVVHIEVDGGEDTTTYILTISPDDSGPFYGDVNGDDVLNGVDQTWMNRYFSGLLSATQLEQFSTANADVSGDGVLNGVDQTRMNRYFSGIDGRPLGTR